MDNEGQQTLIVRLPAELLRSATHLAGSAGGYESVSELVEVALRNQLTLESGAEDAAPRTPEPRGGDMSEAILAVPPRRDLGFAEPADEAPQALSAFTNRLFPIKLACRAGANLASGDTWPELGLFHGEAARAARALGLDLRRDDETARRRGANRRWIALPVGSDPAAAARRFAAHFTIDRAADGRLIGPMGDLGLANVGEGGTLQLTDRGWALARAPSPLLGETAGHTLGSEEREIFVGALDGDRPELARISEFAGSLDGTTRQAELDARLGEKHPKWSESAVRSHRAAMLGRLGDLGLAEVTGRGPGATVVLAGDVPALLRRNHA